MYRTFNATATNASNSISFHFLLFSEPVSNKRSFNNVSSICNFGEWDVAHNAKGELDVVC